MQKQKEECGGLRVPQNTGKAGGDKGQVAQKQQRGGKHSAESKPKAPDSWGTPTSALKIPALALSSTPADVTHAHTHYLPAQPALSIMQVLKDTGFLPLRPQPRGEGQLFLASHPFQSKE